MAARLAAAIVLAAACSVPAAVLALRVVDRTTCGVVTDRGTVDLSRLRTASSERLLSTYGNSNTSVYLWSPCVDYDIAATSFEVSDLSKPSCRAFAMLEYIPDEKRCEFMGSQSSAKYSVSDGRLVLTYEHSLYKPKIVLMCGDDGEESWSVIASDIFEPEFALKSPELCLDGEDRRSSRLSSFLRRLPGYGTLAIIALAAVSFLYVLCGTAYKRLKYKTKLRDSLPNNDFWYELPSLIRDGAKFAVCRYRKRTAYSKVRDLEGKDDDLDGSSSDEDYSYVVNPRAVVPRFQDASAAAGGGAERVALLHKPGDADDSHVDPVDL